MNKYEINFRNTTKKVENMLNYILNNYDVVWEDSNNMNIEINPTLDVISVLGILKDKDGIELEKLIEGVE